MKLTVKKITEIIPVSYHSVHRISKESPDFPQPQRIGVANYYDGCAFFNWLNSRAQVRGGDPELPVVASPISNTDKLLGVKDVAALLGRSKPWVFTNIVKIPELTIVDLSTSGDSGNPRRYFIEREVRARFPELIELQESVGV